MIPEIRAASSVLPSHTGGNSRSPRSTPRRRRAPGGGVTPGGPGPRGSRFETTARPGVHFATTPGGEVPSARSGSQDIPVWPASWKGRPDGACRAYGGSSRACRAVRARGRRPRVARAGAHRPARGSARASADVPRRGARAQRGRRPPPLRRARVRALPGLRNPRAWLRPGPVRRVQARIPGGVLVQEPRSLPLLQRAPDARHGRAPGRCRLPARAGAAMGALAPALGALAACAGCSSREPRPGDRAAGHLRPLPAPGTKGTLRRGDLHSALGGEPQLEPALPLRRTRRGVRPRRDGRVLFVPARPPTDEEVHKVLLRIARKLRGLLLPKQPEDPIDALDAGYAESVQSMQMTGLADPPRPRRCSAFIEGFSLHAGVHLHANDREGLEHLLAYGARGPISLERLSTLLDGRICYRLQPPARWPLRAVLHAGRVPAQALDAHPAPAAAPGTLPRPVRAEFRLAQADRSCLPDAGFAERRTRTAGKARAGSAAESPG